MQVEFLSRPCQGETQNGDAVIVRQQQDRTLLAVVDVLGHGPAAQEVAVRAQEQLLRSYLGDGVMSVLRDLHGALKATRGAAATICLVAGDQLEVAGVGNVEFRALSSRGSMRLTPGILGASIRDLRSFVFTLPVGERLLLFSDGISTECDLEETRRMTPAQACSQILERFGRSTDDATVLVADLEAH